MKPSFHVLNKNKHNVFLSIVLVLLTAGCSYSPIFSPSDIDSAVTIIESRRTIEIKPVVGETSATGLIFYPGGLVDSHVYNELLAQFTETYKTGAAVFLDFFPPTKGITEKAYILHFEKRKHRSSH